jgi:hypothetical protein
MNPLTDRIASILLVLALALAAACASDGTRATPSRAPAQVVPLAHITADEAAKALCDRYKKGGRAEKIHHGGCAYPGDDDVEIRRRAREAWLIVTPDPRTNSLVLAVSAAHQEELERALEILKELDVPRTAG